VRYERWGPAIDPVFTFPNGEPRYWSSSSVVSSPKYAWYVNIGNGYVANRMKSGGHHVRAVRGAVSR